MTSAIKFAIQINNIGVRLLEQGRRDEAWELFQGGIEVMLHSNEDLGEGVVGHNKYAQRAKKLVMQIRREPSNGKTQECSYFVETDRSALEYSTGFIYQHGIIVIPAYVARCRGNQQALRLMISSLILYNIALVHHLSYLDRPGKNELLDISLDLYKKADLLMKRSVQCLHESVFLDVRMVIVNNMAVACHDLYQYDYSKVHFQRLSRLVKYAKATILLSANKDSKRLRQNHSISSSFKSEILKKFELNVSYLTNEPNTARAA